MKHKKLFLAIIGFMGLFAVSYFAYDILNLQYSQKNMQIKGENSQSKDSKNLIKKKRMAADFVVYDENLNKVKLSDYIGKPVVLNFWASWCPPCKAEMPGFNEISRKYKQDELVILMINLTDGQRETVNTAKKFIADNNYSMTVLFDKDNAAAINYNIESIPRTIFIDKDGYIIQDHLGQISSDELEDGIKTLMST